MWSTSIVARVGATFKMVGYSTLEHSKAVSILGGFASFTFFPRR